MVVDISDPDRIGSFCCTSRSQCLSEEDTGVLSGIARLLASSRWPPARAPARACILRNPPVHLNPLKSFDPQPTRTHPNRGGPTGTSKNPLEPMRTAISDRIVRGNIGFQLMVFWCSDARLYVSLPSSYVFVSLPPGCFGVRSRLLLKGAVIRSYNQHTSFVLYNLI